MENFNVEQNEFENKKKRLEVAFQKVEKITDKLGKGIDDGIKEAVAILMAMNLNIYRSIYSGTKRLERRSKEYRTM
jgi:hypothetical protein